MCLSVCAHTHGARTHTHTQFRIRVEQMCSPLGLTEMSIESPANPLLYEPLGLVAEHEAWGRQSVHARQRNTHISHCLLRPSPPLLAQPQRGFLSCGLMACIYFKEAILILKRYLGELGTINTSFFKKFVSFFPACNLTLTGTIQIKCSRYRLPPSQP